MELSGGGTVNISGFLKINPQKEDTTNNLILAKNTQFGGLTGAGYAENRGVMTLNVGSDTVTYDGVLSGSGSLIKTGAGTQIFTKPQTFTGAITIENGTMKFVSSDTVSRDVEAAAGGTLELAAVDETFHAKGVVLDSGSKLVLDFKSDTDFATFAMAKVPTYDSAAGFLGMNFLDGYYPVSTSQTYKVSDNIALTENKNLEDWLLAGQRYEWNLNWLTGEGGGLYLSRDANAVPEPGTWLLALLGTAGLALIKKKRSRA